MSSAFVVCLLGAASAQTAPKIQAIGPNVVIEGGDVQVNSPGLQTFSLVDMYRSSASMATSAAAVSIATANQVGTISTLSASISSAISAATNAGSVRGQLSTMQGQLSTQASSMQSVLQSTMTGAVAPLISQVNLMSEQINPVLANFSAVSQSIPVLQTAVSELQGDVSTIVAQLAAPARPARPRSCAAMNLTLEEAGMYTIYPLGTAESTQVWCTALSNPNTPPTNKADWMLIASQADQRFGHVLADLLGTVPTTTRDGAHAWFFTHDLKDFANEIFVSNELGQSHVFRAQDFTGGPLVLDSDNFVASDSHYGCGIISGNNYPVVHHFQVEQACRASAEADTGGCYVTDCQTGDGNPYCFSDDRYSGQKMTMFDWDPHVNVNIALPNVAYHASFGQSNRTRDTWSAQGVFVAIR